MCLSITPKSSCRLRGDDTSKLSTIYDDVLLYREKGEVVIMGDLNCRVGTQADFIDMDKSDEYLNLPDTMENISIDDIIEENSNIVRKRTSEDQVINENGKELLQLCRTNNLYILNPSPLSDHNIVSASFKFVRHVINDTARERNCPTYNWKEEHKSLYMDSLNSPHVSNQLGFLRDNLTTYSDINSLENNVNILSNVILTAATLCKVNHSHRSHCKTVKSAPWYDKECSTNRIEYNKWRNA